MTNDIASQREKLKLSGYALIQYDNREIHSYPYDAPWLSDESFGKLYDAIRENTLVDRSRCYSLYKLMEQINKLPGDILEVGTWRAGTAGILTSLAQDKTVYLADTYEGIVKSADWEHYTDRAHSDTSEQLVLDFLQDTLKVSNFKILKGIFPEDTGKDVDAVKFSLVHIDVDVYQSAKDVFEYVWDKVVPGGMVVFDDYGFVSACAGIYKYVNEISHDPDKLFIHNTNGHAYIVKR